MENATLLLLQILLGAFGLGFFVYGRRQKAIVPLAVGMALCVVPYFVSDVLLLLGIGVVFMALPYFLRI